MLIRTALGTEPEGQNRCPTLTKFISCCPSLRRRSARRRAARHGRCNSRQGINPGWGQLGSITAHRSIGAQFRALLPAFSTLHTRIFRTHADQGPARVSGRVRFAEGSRPSERRLGMHSRIFRATLPRALSARQAAVLPIQAPDSVGVRLFHQPDRCAFGHQFHKRANVSPFRCQASQTGP